jgi:hypothetical protein
MVTSDDMKTGLVLLTSAKKPKPGFTLTIIDSSNYNGENKSQSFAPFRYQGLYLLILLKNMGMPVSLSPHMKLY